MGFDIKTLMEQAKTLQAEIEKSQEKLEDVIVTGSAGADMIQVTINGVNRILKIEIADELYNTDNKKMLTDLIVAAVNNAYENVQKEITKEMGKITSGFPGFPNFA